MGMKCRACGFDHGTLTCVVAKGRREYEARLTAPVAIQGGVNFEPAVNAAPIEVAVDTRPAVNKSKRGAYPNTDARREYMREKMRAVRRG